MKRVLFFGTFDPIHLGHRKAFQYAKALGEHLAVVVARDSTIFAEKKRASYMDENKRLATVAADTSVDEAMLGDVDSASYTVLTTTPFDILALGYDQKPSDEEVAELLHAHAVPYTRIVRIPAFQPEQYKSSLLRSS